MNAILVTFKKELWSYCCSPVTYLIAVLFYLWRGFEVVGKAREFAVFQVDQDLFATSYFGLTSTFFMAVFVPPILTMRCFAEERRTGSMETLMTAPVRDHEVVLGKWLAAVAFYALLWLPTIVILWALTGSRFLAAENFSFAPVATAYLGLFLLAAMLLAIGCLTSSLTDNLLLAVIAGIIACLLLLTAPSLLATYVQPHLDNYYVAELFAKLNVWDHFGNWFARGLVETGQVAFYLAGTAVFLFLTTQSLAARRVG